MHLRPKPLTRLDFYVVLRILEALWEMGGESKKTELINASQLNFLVFIRYTDSMETMGLISARKNGRNQQVIRITKLGVQAIMDLSKYIGKQLKSQRGSSHLLDLDV